jgi:hypothetical protein
MITIDYENSEIKSLTKSFFGSIKGKKFEIIASWNQMDDWYIDVVDWIDDIGTEDDEADVIEEFYNGLESIGEVAQG